MNKKLQFTLLLSLVILLSSFIDKTKENKIETPSTTINYGHLKAALKSPAGKAYFFTAKKYYRQNLSSDKLEKSAVINGNFKGLINSVDAALLHTNGKGYFFKSNKYYRYNFYTRKVDKIGVIGKDGWKNVPSNIDAAVVHSNGKAYFFKGSKYYRYNSASKKVDKVASIKDNWKGVPNNVDAALRHTNGKIYFFKGNKYYRYSSTSHKVDKVGTIGVDGWKGLSFSKATQITSYSSSPSRNTKLKITLTSMNILKINRTYDFMDVLLQQTIRYKANGKNVPLATKGYHFNKFFRDTEAKNYKLKREGLGLLALIYPDWENFKSVSGDKHPIANHLTYSLNSKEVIDGNALMEIRTNLSGIYFKNKKAGINYVMADNSLIEVKIDEVLKYLLNPNGIPSNYFNNDGYHYSGADGSVMPFKIANDRNALDGYIEYRSSGIIIRTYYHFELVE